MAPGVLGPERIVSHSTWGMTGVRKMSKSEAPTVPSVFRGLRLGIVTIFGVLLPGVWFWASTIFLFTSLWGLEGQASVFAPLKLISFPQPVLWIFGFVLVYVAGSQLRAISPNPIDQLSISWQHVIHRSWLIERTDKFPYLSLPSYFDRRGMAGFAEFIPWSREANRGACSTLFVNYSKLCVASRDRQMGDFLDQEEAFIRAMSGVAWATIASLRGRTSDGACTVKATGPAGAVCCMSV